MIVVGRSVPLFLNLRCKSSPFSSPLLLRFHHRGRNAANEDKETFYSDETVSWSSLGISHHLSHSLSTIRPSLIQAASIPAILNENTSDVIVAAETGSGKTHAYLVPLFHKHLQLLLHNPPLPPVIMSLVLCPNVMLCDQVVRMANSICNDKGQPLLRAAAVCGRHGDKPNILVSTPAALLNYLHAIDPRRAEFVRHVKHVVFDEADMLLCGSFQNHVIRLINMFRFDEKVLSRAKNAPADNPLDMESESVMQFDLEDSQDIPMPEDVQHSEDGNDDGHSLQETEPLIAKKRDWRRTREIYERSKQYIFVAATLPENGKRTAGGELKRLFPDATWVSGLYLHRHNPRLEQKWIQVTVDSQVDVLIDAVNHTTSDNGLRRTMIFANTVEAVEAIAQVLHGAGIECYCYHSDSSLEERTRNLVDFQQKGGIFVCTDAAARGTDIPNVSHVIQAEFATSAVDFLHRVGRTARAGQPGLVTSMYNESNRDLVAAVRLAGNLCEPVEKAFSRKRSFRKKLKKRGNEKTREPVCKGSAFVDFKSDKEANRWYAKRFLHPDIVAPYDYIFIWDEDLGVDHFNAEEYIKLVRKHGLEISQPGLDPSSRGLTWQMTKRRGDREVHKETQEKPGWCSDPHLPPCAAFVEIMAPVFSREAWRCVWHVIQNDLIHGWGLDFALQKCAEPAHEKIGVVDAQWIVHQGVPSLGNQGKGENGKQPWQGVRERCQSEWRLFRERVENADKEYYKSIGVDPSNFTAH